MAERLTTIHAGSDRFCAETEPMAVGKARITLRSGALTTRNNRTLGLAIKVGRSDGAQAT